jgi:hypothetical protein
MPKLKPNRDRRRFHQKLPCGQHFQVFPAHSFFTLSENKMPPPACTSKYYFWSLNGLLGVAFALELCASQFASYFDAATLVLAAVASVAALNRRLPLQNVLAAALIAAAVGAIAHGLTTIPNLSVPFGPLVFNPAAGAKLFNTVPWIIPVLWIVAIFNARGTARLILRPWRKVKNYGYWLIGLTAALAVAFDLALEPFACRVRHFWLWQPTKISLTWQGATPLNFLGWAFVSLLILAFASPSLIRKQPGSSKTPDFHSLILWLGALCWFATGSAGSGLWWPVGVDATMATVTAFFAIRGAKW